jgi:hypothetical protein
MAPQDGFEIRQKTSANLSDFRFPISDFRFRLSTDTPKNTPSKRWLLPDVVGCQFVFSRLLTSGSL